MTRSVKIGNATISVDNNDTIEFRNALCKYTDPEIFFIKICQQCDHEIDCAAYAYS
jgi:hypothetical protein